MDAKIQEMIEAKAAEIQEELSQFSLDRGLLEEGVQLQFILTAKLVEPVSSVVQSTGEEPLLKEVLTRERMIESGATGRLATTTINFLTNNCPRGYIKHGEILEALDWHTATFDQFRVLYARLEKPAKINGVNFGEKGADALLKFMIHFGYYTAEE